MPAVCQLLVTGVLKTGPSGVTLVPSHNSYDNSIHSYDCQNLCLTQLPVTQLVKFDVLVEPVF